jgi:hypothetical protein
VLALNSRGNVRNCSNAKSFVYDYFMKEYCLKLTLELDSCCLVSICKGLQFLCRFRTATYPATTWQQQSSLALVSSNFILSIPEIARLLRTVFSFRFCALCRSSFLALRIALTNAQYGCDYLTTFLGNLVETDFSHS